MYSEYVTGKSYVKDRQHRKKTLMYYLVSSDCVKAHSEKVIFEQTQETRQ